MGKIRLVGWLYNVEQYFYMNQVLEWEKISTIALCMEGAALGWFQWMEMHEPVMTWDEFKEAILDKFGSTQDGDLQEQLMALRQIGTM